MATFFLHYVLDGVRVEDQDGQDLPSLGVARQEAVLGFRSIQGHRLTAGLPLQNGHVEITDSAGERVGFVSDGEALRADQE
jgi:hypothetical protein